MQFWLAFPRWLSLLIFLPGVYWSFVFPLVSIQVISPCWLFKFRSFCSLNINPWTMSSWHRSHSYSCPWVGGVASGGFGSSVLRPQLPDGRGYGHVPPHPGLFKCIQIIAEAAFRISFCLTHCFWQAVFLASFGPRIFKFFLCFLS